MQVSAGTYSGDAKPGTIDSGHTISVSGNSQGAGTSVTAQFVSEISSSTDDRLQEAIERLGLVLGIVHGLLQPAYSVPVVPNFTQGSMTTTRRQHLP